MRVVEMTPNVATDFEMLADPDRRTIGCLPDLVRGHENDC